ncbi:MAG: iron-sulfur cluster repair di-iron protein [Opitutaceae bacterium]|nr:iron-sulfur cluster repair di-iron protein [Opitutaceae bacterium]
MTPPQDQPAFTSNTPVGAIVAGRPGLARLFEHLGIDYCCGGKLPLGAACRQRGLDTAATLNLLHTAVTDMEQTQTDMDATGMTGTELADHIERTHHAYTKAELPHLVALADRVAAKHGERDPRLVDLAVTLRILAADMLDHMEKEEIALFPLIRRIETEAQATCACEIIATPIRCMEAEHNATGRAVAHLRELTDHFTPDAAACQSHRALLAGLAAFEADLHRHVHKENNILFPGILARIHAA